MYDTPVGHAVRDALQTIAKHPESPLETIRLDLRARVEAAVDELTTLGWPIERIIVRMKEVADEVGLPRTWSSGYSRDAVVRDVVGWCITRRFGGPDLTQ